MRNGESHQSGLLDEESNTVSMSPVITATKTIPGSDSYKMTMVDDGNSNNIEYDLSSSSVSINWMYRVRLSASSVDVTNNATASSMFNDTTDSVLMNDPGSSARFDLECTPLNAQDGRFTYIAIPEAFGTLASVLQNSSTDVTADFSLVTDGTLTVENSNGVSIAYYIYRTNDTGAFNDGITLNVKLN